MEHQHSHTGTEPAGERHAAGPPHREHTHGAAHVGHAPGMAGMDHSGHSSAAGHMMHMGNLGQRLLVSLILAVPIILLSPMMGLRLPFQFVFPGSGLVVLILASILYFYGGKPFLQGARDEIAERKPAMMTLITLGITVAYVYSIYAYAVHALRPAPDGAHPAMDFFWELATLIVIMLLGHWIEMNAVGKAGNALESMAKLLPASALLLDDDGGARETPLASLHIGDRVLVRSGEKVPADGLILDGATSVNESLVTGEAREVEKKPGDSVIGGSVNGSGAVTIQVTGTGESGYLARVMRLVEDARQSRTRLESLSDRVAGWLFYAAVGSGLLAFAVWYGITLSLDAALTRLVTVLVIACPHALGLAVPLVTARSVSLAAQNGLLVRNRRGLEAAAGTDVVMMDKTGTLTEGNFSLSTVHSFVDGLSENRILQIAGGLEQGASHPLAAGIMNALKDRGLAPSNAETITTLPGLGLQGTVDGAPHTLASVSYLKRQHIDFDGELIKSLAGRGESVSILLRDDVPLGLIAEGDGIKADARAVIAALKERKIRPVMLTGDNETAAVAAAVQLGVDDVHASLMPGDKARIVTEYKSSGHTVMMVGDGVNDAPSLVAADVGVAVGAGTDVAVDSADIVLAKSRPGDILHLLSLARNTARKTVQNLWWGAGYNLVAIPLAAGVLAPAGIVLSPAMGAVLMSLSTLIVAANAMTLRIK